jgi:hypothetical protein
MNQDQFLPEDSELSRSLVQDQQRLLEGRAVIKRWLAFSAGNTPDGVAKTRTNVLIETSIQYKTITGKDVLMQGTLYQIGDLEVSTEMPVFGPDNVAVTQADKMIFDGQDYTLVGKPYKVPMAGGSNCFRSTWRRA